MKNICVRSRKIVILPPTIGTTLPHTIGHWMRESRPMALKIFPSSTHINPHRVWNPEDFNAYGTSSIIHFCTILVSFIQLHPQPSLALKKRRAKKKSSILFHFTRVLIYAPNFRIVVLWCCVLPSSSERPPQINSIRYTSAGCCGCQAAAEQSVRRHPAFY